MEAADPWILVLGFALLFIVLSDFLLATIAATNRAALSNLVARAVFVAVRPVIRWLPNGWSHNAMGPLVVVAVATFWIGSVSLSWLLIFSASPRAVVTGEAGIPADGAQTYAYVGSLLSTLGSSAGRSGGTAWDLLSMAAAVNGMVILTISVSFIISVKQTVAAGRSLCAMVRILDPADPDTRVEYVERLLDLAAGLRSSSISLYYSARREERRLPQNLVTMMRKARRNPPLFRLYARALDDMPWLELDAEASEDEILRRLERWASRYDV